MFFNGKQTQMTQSYPCHYSSTAWISIMGSLQAIVYALCIERDMKMWKLGWNITLLTAAYMVSLQILRNTIINTFNY